MIKKIAPDKWKHFFAGMVLGAVLQAFLGYIFPANPMQVALGSFVLVIVISYAFELFSLITGRGHYDIMDAVAGTIGGVVGLSIVWWLMFMMISE